jgi:hypothetical protein
MDSTTVMLRDGSKEWEFDFRQKQEFLLSSTESRPALGHAQPPIQWVRGALSPRVKLPGREIESSPHCTAKVKNTWSYTSTPTVFMALYSFKHT